MTAKNMKIMNIWTAVEETNMKAILAVMYTTGFEPMTSAISVQRST